jgi:hypothetical protein
LLYSGSVPSKRTQKLFADLRKIRFGVDRPDQHENLLDVLEVAAVFENLKPAHLHGQGLRDAETLAAFEKVALKHQLRVHRTQHVSGWSHRPYRGEPDFGAWRERPSTAAEDQVLWIYRDEALEPTIDRAARGEVRAGEVLGYPECCEIAHAELILIAHEQLEHGYRVQYGANTTEDLIRLAREDRAVSVDVDMGCTLFETQAKLPFIQFSACEHCLKTPASAAEELNATMQRLARSLGHFFAKQIEDAAHQNVEAARKYAAGDH